MKTLTAGICASLLSTSALCCVDFQYWRPYMKVVNDTVDGYDTPYLYNSKNLKVRNINLINSHDSSKNYFEDYPLNNCQKNYSEYNFNSKNYRQSVPGTYYRETISEVYETNCGNVVKMCDMDILTGFPGGICDVKNLPEYW